MSLKNSSHTIANRNRDWILAQCLSQLCHRLPQWKQQQKELLAGCIR
jgi:hypothetical protein